MTGHRTAELRAGDFKHHAGVVALATHQAGSVGDAIPPAGNLLTGGDDVPQIGGEGLVVHLGGHGVQAEIPGAQELVQRRHGLGSKALLGQLVLHAVGADLVQLVEADADRIQIFGGKAHLLQHGPQDAAVIDVDGEAGEADGQQRPGGHVDELHFSVGAGIPQNVNIALDKLPQAPLLGTLGAVDAVGLDDLEGGGQLVAVGRIVAGERQRQVIAQAHVGQLLFVAGGQRLFQLVAALEHLEDQVEVVAAVALVQVLHVLQDGGGDALETGGAVGGQDLALDIVAKSLLTGQQIAHAF